MTKAERQELLKEKLKAMRVYEEELYRNGIRLVAGVDEVGRGPLAGPVVTACVVLPADFDVLGVDDSKKLSEKKREELCEIIKEKAVALAIGIRDNRVIDDINILNATKEAMKDAVREADRQLKDMGAPGVEHLLIDAVKLDGVNIPQSPIVKGDAKSVSIAAASIVAKVTRDHMMRDFAVTYPGYAFESNKGYGTKAHYEGLEKYGLCPIHRRTFLKNFTENEGVQASFDLTS